MPTYEQKLAEFAQGKRLLRLARPIRDRADAFCDACGSIQPRTLYALADLDTERHYFVGDTCLKELAKRGAVLRYGRRSGREAFETEMKLRALEYEAASKTRTTANGGPTSNPGGQKVSVDSTQPNPPNDARPLFPAILVIETAEEYQAFASAFLAQDGTYSWGHAREARYQEVWRQGGEGGLVLEKDRVDRPDALSQCLTKAWEEAISQVAGSRMGTPSVTDSNGDDHSTSLPRPLLDLLKLDAIANLGSHRRANLQNGYGSVPPPLIAPSNLTNGATGR